MLGYAILNFKHLGNTESVVTNAILLMRGEYQISKATHLMGICPGGGGGVLDLKMGTYMITGG